jgi:hypothetical protein
MLEYFAHQVFTLRQVFLAAGTVLLVLGGVFCLGRHYEFGGVLLHMAVVAMLGAIACAIGDLTKKE